ncbi:MAG: T9SS type A sorting domain-containing protein [Ignavibacteriaceae bacterium]
MKKLLILFSVLLSIQLFAQAPDPPFNPMTAPGARGISTLNHTLYWQNPNGVLYNEVYFSDDSALVANNDTSVRVINGYPSTVFSSLDINGFGPFNISTKYYWKVLEYNSSGQSMSPVWDFTSFAITLLSDYYYSFNNGFEGWQILGPQGLSNWYWSNSTHTGSTPGEIVFRWDPIFLGDSYFISPEILASPGSQFEIHFNYYEDWWSNTVTLGCAITSNNGTTWHSIWELQANGNVGPGVIDTVIDAPGNFKLGFYYTGNSNDIDFLYIDSVYAHGVMPLTPPYPPAMLSVVASETQQKVTLNWTSGSSPGGGLWGYQIQRKFGLPESDSSYNTIATTDLTQSFEDLNVELNKVYTYRIRSLAMGFNSVYGNEATAYVPAIVPVELLSFSSSVVDDDVTLNWTTATETNNSGFQVERRKTLEARSEEWENLGFVNGNGTTTETKSYSYNDENLSAGKYQYRLKQIDFDGTFEYSNIAEAEILPPARFSLEQNYPNPFNPSTSIQYAIASKQFVQLKVFDILGKEITTLVNEEKSAGNHKIEFNASNLSSGIYYYKITAGEFVQTRKMILLK